MGTRCITIVYDEGMQPIMNLYRQFDGYISGHGVELAEFLSGKTLVNGFGFETEGIANGMGCLAAQMVCNFKVGVGGFYIYSPTDTDCGQDYTYHVYEDSVEVYSYSGKLFAGSWSEFSVFCSNKEVE